MLRMSATDQPRKMIPVPLSPAQAEIVEGLHQLERRKADPIRSTQWAIVCACLHYDGKAYDALDTIAQLGARRICDGFGEGCSNHDLLWDWSHVRDSSELAIERASGFLVRRFLLRGHGGKLMAAVAEGGVAFSLEALTDLLLGENNKLRDLIA